MPSLRFEHLLFPLNAGVASLPGLSTQGGPVTVRLQLLGSVSWVPESPLGLVDSWENGRRSLVYNKKLN